MPADTLESLRQLLNAATPGEWRHVTVSDGWDGITTEFAATEGAWKTCPYFCIWPDASDTSRGAKNTPGHEHLEYEPVIAGWGYDASGLHVEDSDAALIVAMKENFAALLDIAEAAQKLGPPMAYAESSAALECAYCEVSDRAKYHMPDCEYGQLLAALAVLGSQGGTE